MVVADGAAAAKEAWQDRERAAYEQERQALEAAGIVLPEGHLEGYQYRPKTKIVQKQPWDVLPLPNFQPKCTSLNWSHGAVTFEVGEGIAYLTLNRPEAMNTLNDAMSQALHDAVFELSGRSDIRIMVLKAEGKLFCAGRDPKAFADVMAMTEADNRKVAISFMKFLHMLQNLPQFTVGLVQGSVMGSGVGLIAALDAVLAVRAARFTVSEVKLGTTPATIAPFVTKKVGVSNAKRILCTAENLTADKAMEMGLVTEVTDSQSDFSSYVSDLCSKVSLCAPVALGKAKRLVHNVSDQPIDTATVQYTGSEAAKIWQQEEAQKGMAAVQARSKPSWADAPVKPLY